MHKLHALLPQRIPGVLRRLYALASVFLSQDSPRTFGM